jgi:hypothetical protein
MAWVRQQRARRERVPHLVTRQPKKKVYLLLDSMSQPKSQWMLLSRNLAITYSTTSKKRYPTKALFEKQES